MQPQWGLARERLSTARRGATYSTTNKDLASSTEDDRDNNSTGSQGLEDGNDLGSGGDGTVLHCLEEAVLGSLVSNVDQDKEDILKDIWPGSHNIYLLTCFVTCHFTGDWRAYLLFARWVEARSLTASRVPIRLEEWLEKEEDKFNEDRGEAGIRDGGSRCRGLVDENMLNMCNKTCSVALSHLGSDILGNKATPRSAGPTPSKKGPLWMLSIIQHSDIHTIFPPVARICTPNKLATEYVMEDEDEMALQAKEELAVAGRVQAFQEKFSVAANDKFLMANEKEVCWVADQPTYSTKATFAIMKEAAPHPLFPEFHLKSCAVKKGSKHRASTCLERMSAQIKEQERIMDTTSALAVLLWNPGQLPGHQNPLPLPVHAPDSTPVEPATPVCQVSLARTLASDLATLRQHYCCALLPGLLKQPRLFQWQTL